MIGKNAISVYLVGPQHNASRAIVEDLCKREGLCSSRVIDVVWSKEKKGGGISNDDHTAARQQLSREMDLQSGFYISIGSLIDLAFFGSAKANSSYNDPAKFFQPYIRDPKAAEGVLGLYRRSLIVVLDINNSDGEAVTDFTATLQQLRIPFYHMQEPDISLQSGILKHAVQDGAQPSPLASLSFYEHLSNKKKKGPKSGNKNASDAFFDTFNLPYYWNQNITCNTGGDGVRSIFISETEMIQTLETPVKYLTSRFMNWRGRADDLFLVEFDRGIPSDVVLRLLDGGIFIQGCRHSFLGCSSSGLKKRKAYVIRGSDQVADDERQKYGDFASLSTASKQISRFSLMLTNVAITTVKPTRVMKENDVDVNNHCFTDGCGKVSSDLAAALIRETRKTLARQNEDKSHTPSIFQIRMGGVKGIVQTDSTLTKGTIVIRPSMIKFQTSKFPEISLCDYSRPFSFGHLNKQYITLLSGLGVSDDSFLSIQREYFQQIQKMTSDFDSAWNILEWLNRSSELLIDNDGETMEERLGKVKSIQSQLIGSAPKLKILVPESRTLFGVAETPIFCPETKQRLPGILRYGECLVRVTMKGGQRVSLQNQRVIVSKNPCYLLGDVRILRAVSSVERPELHRLEKDLVDCIVFPIEGVRPHSEEIAGSDLDGDQYFVCWDERLIPPHQVVPYTYPGFEPKKQNKKKPGQIDLVKYFSGQNVVSDLTGRVDSNYKAWAAIKGPASDECVRLGQLFSRVVDSAKSGESVKLEHGIRVPHESRPIPSASSKFVWQQMEHYANLFVEEQLRGGNLDVTGGHALENSSKNEHWEDEMENDLILGLVSRNHLAMSEFTKFRLIMQHLGNSVQRFFHSPYVSCVDFGRFNAYELGYAVHQYHFPLAVLSNSLMYHSRIVPEQTAFFKKFVNNGPIPWKLYWRSETDSSTLSFADILLHALRKNTDALMLLKLPDSVVVVLRFAVPFEKLKKLRDSIHFTAQQSLEIPLNGFIEVNSVFASKNFQYAFEYKLVDETYLMSIDMSNKSMQIYRDEKRVTFAHLRVDALTSGKRAVLSVDLTRYDRRILTGKRRHPLVRKAPVLDIELFVSNRTTPYAKVPNQIALADVLIDDGDSWDNSSLDFQEKTKGNAVTFEAYKVETDEIMNAIHEIFAEMCSPSVPSRRMMLKILDTVLYPAHRLFGMHDQISSKVQMEIEALMANVLQHLNGTDFNDGTELVFVMNTIPILSDLGIHSTNGQIGHLESFNLLHLTGMVRKWDVWLTLSVSKRADVFKWLESLVGTIDNPIATAFSQRNLFEQLKILLHEMKDGSQDMRSSSRTSRLTNLRIEPSVSMFGDGNESENSKPKMPIVTFYSIQAMPVGLRFARGEHVRIVKQPSDQSDDKILSPREYNLSNDDYDEEFPALTSQPNKAEIKINDSVSKNQFCCLGRVMAVTEAPFSIKIKLISPSYIADSVHVPAPIQECLAEKKDTWFELQVVPANVVAHERIIDSISMILDPKEDNNLYFGHQLSQYIMGCPSITKETQSKVKVPITTLNLRQQEALKNSLSNTLALIHGPPGTGKTTTIVQIVNEVLRSSNDRIIVCAETNLAVDNLALRMISDAQDLVTPGELIRVGSGDKVDEKLKSIHLEAMVKGKTPNISAHDANTEQTFYLSRHKKIMNEILAGARVVFATTIGAGDPILNGQKFEFVVMDEASMSTEPSCLPALSHGCNRFVMVGDHKQLGPHACDSKCISLFERLIEETESKAIPAAITMLNQQHRMHSKLCHFPSTKFYDGKLLTAPGIEKDRIIPNVIFQRKSPVKFVPVKDGKEQRMKSGSWYNEVEIGYVLKAIKDLTAKAGKEKFNGQDITILTPYRAQLARIQIQLRNAWQGSDPLPEVCSIDGYQGRENEIIIFSAVRCGPSLGFCDDARRVNVLLTRAKRGLVIVGDRKTLMKSTIWRAWIEMAEGWLKAG